MLPIVILAGGLATRLQPLTKTTPKSLIDINGEPFLVHQLRLLKSHGISKIVICAGHLGQQIQTLLGTGEPYSMQIQYSFDGDIPLGTGGAIKKALPLLPENFFVLYGDSYLPCRYVDIQRFFFQCNTDGLMTIFKNHNQLEKSNVEYDEGRIIAYDKAQRTAKMHHVDYGLGVFNHHTFDTVPVKQFYDLATVYQTLLRHDQLSAVEVTERFYEIGSHVGIKETADYLKQEKICEL